MDAIGIAIRFGLYLDLMAVFGLAAFALLSLRPGERAGALPLRALIAGAGAIGLLLSAAGLAALAASMRGVALGEVDRETIDILLAGTSIGAAWIVRMAALGLAVILPLVAWRRPTVAFAGAAAAGAVALATLAWSGHAAMDEGTLGAFHLGMDIAHLLAAGIWVGALIGLCLLVARPASRVDAAHLALTHRALAGFAGTGTAVVGVLIVTGLANGWLILGLSGVPTLPFGLYGQLLLAKLALFGAMLALAGSHRFRLVPALGEAMGREDHGPAIAALRRSLALEMGCAVAVLALVAWLGTLDPVAA